MFLCPTLHSSMGRRSLLKYLVAYSAEPTCVASLHNPVSKPIVGTNCISATSLVGSGFRPTRFERMRSCLSIHQSLSHRIADTNPYPTPLNSSKAHLRSTGGIRTSYTSKFTPKMISQVRVSKRMLRPTSETLWPSGGRDRFFPP